MSTYLKEEKIKDNAISSAEWKQRWREEKVWEFR